MLDDEALKRFVGKSPQHSEEIDEVAFSGAVGTDEHIEISQLKSIEFLDGLEPMNRH